MKRLHIVIIVILAVLCAVVMARNVIVKAGAEKAIKNSTGFDLKMGDLDVALIGTSIRIKDMRILNPPDFPERTAMEFEHVYVDYELGALLKDEVKLTSVELNMPRFVIVKNEAGESNTSRMYVSSQGRKTGNSAPEKPEPPKNKNAKQIYIGRVKIEVGKVEMHDYTKKTDEGMPVIKEYALNMKKVFTDIHSLDEIISRLAADAVVGRFVEMAGSAKEAADEGIDEAKRVASDVKEDWNDEESDLYKARENVTDAAKEAGAAAKDIGKDIGKAFSGLMKGGSEE